MINKKKFWAACAAMAAAGIVLTIAGVALGGTVYGIQLNASGLHVYSPHTGQNHGENVYIEKGRQVEAFDSIELDLCQADVRIEASDSENYEIAYHLYGQADTEFECSVSDGRLVLAQTDRINYLNMDFSWFMVGRTSADLDDGYVTVRIPFGQKLSLIHAKTERGGFICSGIEAGRLDVTSEYGDIDVRSSQIQETNAVLECGRMSMEQVSGDRCSIRNEYGDIQMKDLILTGDLEAYIDTGNAVFQNASLRDLKLHSDYGNVDARQTELDNMQIRMEAGDCEFVDAKIGQCSIKSEHGDVNISLTDDAAAYGYRLETEFGSIIVCGEKMGDSYSAFDDKGGRMLQIECETGDIAIE